MRPLGRDRPPVPARRRRRLRVLPQSQPLLLGLPPARPARRRWHPTRARVDLAQTRRTRHRHRTARSLPARRRGDRDRRQGLRQPRVRRNRHSARRPHHPSGPPRRARPRAAPGPDPSTHREHLLYLQGPARPRTSRRSHPARPQSPALPTLPRPHGRDRAQPPPRPPQPLPRALHHLTARNQSSSRDTGTSLETAAHGTRATAASLAPVLSRVAGNWPFPATGPSGPPANMRTWPPPHAASKPHIPRDNGSARLQSAVDAFLSQPRFSAQTRHSYAKTLTALTEALQAAGADPSAAAIEAAARLRWGSLAPATWNRHAATVRSFLTYAARHGLLPELHIDLDRRREPADRTRALPQAALERLWNRRDIALRDKTLWRLLYETAARANEALALDVDDVDLPNRRAAIRGKNGET